MANDDDFDEQPTPDPNRRSAPLKLTDSESRKKRQQTALGVPIMTEELRLLLDGQLSPEEYAQADALRRASNIDPYILWVLSAKRQTRDQRKHESGNKEVERQVATAVQTQEQRLQAIEKRVKLADRVILAAALAVGSGLLWAAQTIWSRSAKETETEYRLRAVEKRAEHDHEWRPDAPKDKP